MTTQPIPAARLYPLLSAIDPDDLAKGQAILVGTGRGKGSQRTFQSLLEAARSAGSAKRFAEKLNGDATAKGLAAAGERSRGSIVGLTLEYRSDGYTEVRVTFENGDQIISIYPTAN